VQGSRSVASFAGRKSEGGVKRAASEEGRREQPHTDQPDPVPSLDWHAVLKRERDESQSSHYPYILIDLSDIYRHRAPPSEDLTCKALHAKAYRTLIFLNREIDRRIIDIDPAGGA